jgi:hypothetical protein
VFFFPLDTDYTGVAWSEEGFSLRIDGVSLLGADDGRSYGVAVDRAKALIGLLYPYELFS